MTKIKDLIEDLKVGHTGQEISDLLGVSLAMLSKYVNDGFNPILRTALIIYIKIDVVVHPFSEESLQYERDKYE